MSWFLALLAVGIIGFAVMGLGVGGFFGAVLNGVENVYASNLVQENIDLPVDVSQKTLSIIADKIDSVRNQN